MRLYVDHDGLARLLADLGYTDTNLITGVKPLRVSVNHPEWSGRPGRFCVYLSYRQERRVHRLKASAELDSFLARYTAVPVETKEVEVHD